MLRCRDAALTLLVAMTIAARPAGAQVIAGPPLNPQARAHFDKALAAYSAANYRAASVELELAYGLDARRELLFAWAQAERLSGNCDRAVMLYRRFLDQAPSEAAAAKAVRLIELCGATGSVTTPTTPGDDIAVERPLPPPPPPQPQPQPQLQLQPQLVAHSAVESHWYSDPWVDGLVGVGGAAVVASGVFFVLAHSDDQSADAATVYGDARRFADDANNRRLIGTIAAASGGALVLGGLALAWWSHDRDTSVARRWTPQLGPGMIGIAGVY